MDKANKTTSKPISANTAGSKKTATNNQWISTGLKHSYENRERRDGPGGENADN